MNNAQRKYIEQRIHTIFQNRKDKAMEVLNQQFPESVDEVRISIVDLQKAGIDISKLEVELSRSWKKSFDISLGNMPASIEKQVTEAIANKLGITTKADEVKRSKAEEAIVSKLNADEQAALDKLYLGDAEEAMKMIQDLESGK